MMQHRMGQKKVKQYAVTGTAHPGTHLPGPTVATQLKLNICGTANTGPHNKHHRGTIKSPNGHAAGRTTDVLNNCWTQGTETTTAERRAQKPLRGVVPPDELPPNPWASCTYSGHAAARLFHRRCAKQVFVRKDPGSSSSEQTSNCK